MATVILLVAIAIGVGLYVRPNETKSGLIWSSRLTRGAVKDAQKLHIEAKKARLENPELVKETVQLLDATLFDATRYHKNATKRCNVALKDFNAAIAALEKP